jgi:Asp-tRNA(Asn)/Glu-tRNA(Gln) amidotransferase C subunit
METQIPSNFRSLLADFTRDLSTTFPDYSYLWSKWHDDEVSDDQLKIVLDHCLKAMPERFFDILYQNEDIFKGDSETNTYFLPNVSFKFLFNCEDITEKTKKAMWKYLQLLLFSIVGGIKDKANFGDTMNMFEGINEGDLHEKLKETMGGITDFFSNMENLNTESQPTDSGEADPSGGDSGEPGQGESAKEHFRNMFENMGSSFGGMPNMENIQDHLKTLFDGKIGKLAKEMAEEISEEFSDLVGEDMKDVKNTQDVIKKLMKNPKKIMDLMKKVSGKLDSKMKSGEISRDELMKEAGDLMSKMKDMGGQDQFAEMFKKMAGSMGGLGKNMKLDTNALDRMTKQSSTRDRLRSKLEQKKQMQAAELEERKQEILERLDAQQKLSASYSLTQKSEPNNLVFRLEGEDVQEKSSVNSFIHPDLLNEVDKKPTDGVAKKKKKKNKK